MARTDRGNSAAANVLNVPKGSPLVVSKTLGRVVSIVLDETHPRFVELGEWNGLGTIEYTLVDKPVPQNTILPVAKPADPNLKNYPVINEIVLISAFSDITIGQFASSKIPYYTNIVALWNHPHHNAFPQNDNILPPSQQKDYIQTQLGSVRTVTNQETEIFLGETFVERENIHPLKPFEGDVILEGRWGNAIRLGSTVNKVTTKEVPVTYVNNQQIVERYNFESGGTQVPPEFEARLKEINAQAASQPDAKVSVAINAQESKVTNPPQYGVGQLAETRAQTLQSSLTNYSSLNQSPTVNTSVGNTAYVRGVDNPRDPKYTEEQFVEVVVNVETTSTSTQTVNVVEPLNSWSSTPTSGDPITIISNGQGNVSEDGWIPVVEDINNLDSSIWLASTQKIPIVTSDDYKSYDNPPSAPQCYAGNQIILNSGRLVFNSKSDHILLSSVKSIGLSALESVNIDTKKTVIASEPVNSGGGVFLGGKDAKEPILKGDETIKLLDNLVVQLSNLATALTAVTPSGGPGVNIAAQQFRTYLLTQIRPKLEDTKSKTSRTL
jgi:hypothetical protein